MPNTDNTKKFISLRRLENFKTLLDEEIDSKFNIQFTQSDQLENITSGDDVSTSFGKMSKWFPYIKASIKSKNMLKLVEPGYFWSYNDSDKSSAKFTRNGNMLTIHVHSSEAGRLGFILCDTIPPPVDLTPENAQSYPDDMSDHYVENTTDYTVSDLDLSELPSDQNVLVCPYVIINNVRYFYFPIVTINTSILLNNKIIVSGVEMTYNDNGTITLNGTANIFNSVNASTIIPLGTPSVKSGISYTLTGCPQGGGDETYAIGLDTSQDADLSMVDTGSGATATLSVSEQADAALLLGPNVQCNNLTFSPMLCTTEDYQESSDFEPWRPSLDELYDMIGDIDSTLEAVL